MASALLLYFGYVRTLNMYEYFGLDVDSMGFSSQDYIVRSAEALFGPVAGLVLLALLAPIIDQWVTRTLQVDDKQQRWRRQRRISRLLLSVSMVMVINGIAAFLYRTVEDLEFVAAPLSLGFGAAMIWYRHWRLRGGSFAVVSAQHMRSYAATAMIILSLFWTANLYARAVGTGRAQYLSKELYMLPGVVLDSPERLFFPAGGVTENALVDSTSGHFKYRYRGFRLLVATGHILFLIPEQWTIDGSAVLMVPDAGQVRLSFYPR